MSPGAKIFLTLAVAGGVIGVLAVAASKDAHASPATPKQPKPSNQPPDVIVPEPGSDPASLPPASQPQPSVAPPFVPPAAQPPQAPPIFPAPVPPGVTVSLPNPLGGPPLGTFDPATGNVFGPNGIIIGTFNPSSGVFTAANGMKVQIPGFPLGGAPPNVPAPAIPPAATLPPLPTVPTGPAVPVPPTATPASAPVTTVSADTAAMVAALLDAETRPGWNTTDPTVLAWQRARPPLVQDGKFGPKTALQVAEQFGTIPLIRFWPLGTAKAKLLQDYQAALIELATHSTDPVRAQQLRFSAQREQAQAFSVKGKAPAVPEANQIQIAKVA